MTSWMAIIIVTWTVQPHTLGSEVFIYPDNATIITQPGIVSERDCYDILFALRTEIAEAYRSSYSNVEADGYCTITGAENERF